MILRERRAAQDQLSDPRHYYKLEPHNTSTVWGGKTKIGKNA